MVVRTIIAFINATLERKNKSHNKLVKLNRVVGIFKIQTYSHRTYSILKRCFLKQIDEKNQDVLLQSFPKLFWPCEWISCQKILLNIFIFSLHFANYQLIICCCLLFLFWNLIKMHLKLAYHCLSKIKTSVIKIRNKVKADQIILKNKCHVKLEFIFLLYTTCSLF